MSECIVDAEAIKQALSEEEGLRFEITNHLWKHYRIAPTRLAAYVPGYAKYEWKFGSVVEACLDGEWARGIVVEIDTSCGENLPYRVVTEDVPCGRWVREEDVRERGHG